MRGCRPTRSKPRCRRLGDAPRRGRVAIPKAGRRAGRSPLMGIKGVSNLITVKPQITPSELQQKIEDALVRSAKVDASKISVEVQGSAAILKGRVRAWVERREAVRAAWSAPGITWVENQITIETSRGYSAILAMWRSKPVFGSSDVSSNTLN